MVDAEEARRVAEESREKVWHGQSFMRDVFLGNFRIDLLERLSLDEPSRPEFLEFQRKMAEGRAWYQAMPFVCATLARHIYHCLKFNDPYDVEKAFRDSSFAPASQEEQLSLEADLDERFEVMDASLCQLEA